MRILSCFLLIVALCLVANGQAAYTEDFDAFTPLGQLQAQGAPINWEANTLVDVVAHDTGKALQSTSYTDKTVRHDATGVDLALALDQDGIEYGFDVKEDITTTYNMRMYLRDQRTAIYSPSFGIQSGSVVIRTNGEGGTTYTGNNFSGSDYVGPGTPEDPGYWEKGDWLQFKIILTGAGFDTATVKAYNLSRGGLEIPTGLTGIPLGVNPKFHASWTGFNFRGGSTSTTIDNAYVTDYTAPAPPTPGSYIDDFESPETLGTLTGQTGWRDVSPNGTVVTTTTSGEYVGGQGVQNSSSTDQWPQYALDRSEDLGLQVGVFDGIEMGFDFMNAASTLASCRMHFRVDVTGNYSPAFGLQSTGEFMVRTFGEGGDSYLGNTLGDAITAGLYDKGDWVQISLVMRGSLYNTATLYAYNLTKGVDIPTGIVNINLGTDPQLNADDWSRLVFRMSNSTGSTVDNAYIADWVNPNVTAEVVSPTNGEYPVALDNVELVWLSPAEADLHKVYFSTQPDANEFEINTTNTSYVLPYTLEEGTTYYWRIDEVVDGIVNTGDVWSFTTAIGDLGYPRSMAYDGFDYLPNLTLKQSGNGYGGFGWATGWERELGEYCYVTVGSGSLDPAMVYPYGTVGNKIQHTAGGTNNDAMRQLEYPIDLRADQDYYISYLAMGDSDTYNTVGCRLYQSKTNAGPGVHMFYDGYPNVTTPTAYLRDFDGSTWVSNPIGPWASGVVYMVVIKIDANVTGDDVISVSLFDTSNPLPMTEPTVWQQSVSADTDKVYPWIQFSGRADSYDQWHIDEVHVGTGWGAVTGHVEACGDLGTIMDWDLNSDCQVNLGDVAVLAADWLRCTDPAGTGCEWVVDPEEPVFTGLDTSVLGVYEVVSPVTVDGDLTDWDGSRWYDTRFTTGFDQGNAVDITEAKMSLQWDPTSPEIVYMAVKVTDTDLNLTDTPTNWNSGDNLEVRFSINDTDPNTGWYDNETFDVAQYYHVFAGTSGGTSCTLGPVAIASTDDPATDDIDVVYATSVVGNEISYEMALPTYSLFDINTQSGTKLSLIDGDVIAFDLQINSVSATGAGGLFADQDHGPVDWPKFTVTASSSLVLGDMGYLDNDMDLNGEVGLSDLNILAEKWLSCTDPEIPGCDQPWAP